MGDLPSSEEPHHLDKRALVNSCLFLFWCSKSPHAPGPSLLPFPVLSPHLHSSASPSWVINCGGLISPLVRRYKPIALGNRAGPTAVALTRFAAGLRGGGPGGHAKRPFWGWGGTRGGGCSVNPNSHCTDGSEERSRHRAPFDAP